LNDYRFALVASSERETMNRYAAAVDPRQENDKNTCVGYRTTRRSASGC